MFGLMEVAVFVETFMTAVVATTIGAIDGRTFVVVEMVVRIAVAQGEGEVVTASPHHGPIEVHNLRVTFPLPGSEDIAQVGIPTHPEDTIYICIGVQSEQVVEIDFIDCLVLREAEVEFVCHFVGKEERFLASLGEAHG